MFVAFFSFAPAGRTASRACEQQNFFAFPCHFFSFGVFFFFFFFFFSFFFLFSPPRPQAATFISVFSGAISLLLLHGKAVVLDLCCSFLIVFAFVVVDRAR
jgi:hypothetical protein